MKAGDLKYKIVKVRVKNSLALLNIKHYTLNIKNNG